MHTVPCWQISTFMSHVTLNKLAKYIEKMSKIQNHKKWQLALHRQSFSSLITHQHNKFQHIGQSVPELLRFFDLAQPFFSSPQTLGQSVELSVLSCIEFQSLNQSISVFKLKQRNIRPSTSVERPKKQNDTNLRQL